MQFHANCSQTALHTFTFVLTFHNCLRNLQTTHVANVDNEVNLANAADVASVANASDVAKPTTFI